MWEVYEELHQKPKEEFRNKFKKELWIDFVIEILKLISERILDRFTPIKFLNISLKQLLTLERVL